MLDRIIRIYGYEHPITIRFAQILESAEEFWRNGWNVRKFRRNFWKKLKKSIDKALKMCYNKYVIKRDYKTKKKEVN
jgi:hypothetical protein